MHICFAIRLNLALFFSSNSQEESSAERIGSLYRHFNRFALPTFRLMNRIRFRNFSLYRHCRCMNSSPYEWSLCEYDTTPTTGQASNSTSRTERRVSFSKFLEVHTRGWQCPKTKLWKICQNQSSMPYVQAPDWQAAPLLQWRRLFAKKWTKLKKRCSATVFPAPGTFNPLRREELWCPTCLEKPASKFSKEGLTSMHPGTGKL